MIRHWPLPLLLAALVLIGPVSLAAAATAAKPDRPATAARSAKAEPGRATVGKPAQGDEGTVIRGDQEAPLVLYIVPWQDAKPVPLPEPPLLPLLLKAYDNDRSLIDDPANQSIGGGAPAAK